MLKMMDSASLYYFISLRELYSEKRKVHSSENRTDFVVAVLILSMISFSDVERKNKIGTSQQI
jgi:hypothetical protein